MINGINIKINNLSLTVGNNTILHDITVNFEKGKIHAIMGPNGGGKTTLLKCILGQMEYDGEIIFEYEDDKKIGYVPQMLDFEKTLPVTVLDFLCICYQNKPAFSGPNNENKEFFKKVLKEVDLEDKSNRLLGNLSGGELKRLLLAQAINPRPNLLILDEPFAGIDTLGEDYFIEIMKKLRDEGTTILWIHHNIRQIKEVADTITCIKKHICFSCDSNAEISHEELINNYM